MKCYYEELELSCTASNEEITKAYKKLALKYHPDKNMDNVEQAQSRFLDIQKAYKVLTDPHERAWYDRNKDLIEAEELSGSFVNPSSFHNTYVFKNYDDSADGFYTVYRQLFQTIVAEELLFDKNKCEEDFPIFGYSDSDFEVVVKPFYVKWSIFQTKRTFSWTDEISEAEGANRQEVRHIKKLNSKNRNYQVKQYNESVRALVFFLKKRDKRIPKKPPAAPAKTNTFTKPPPSVRRPPIDVDWQAHYQNILGDLDEIDNQIDEFAADSQRQKTNRDFEGIDDEQMKITLEQHSGFIFTDDSDESVVRLIKCILCDKDFKTLAMFLSHIKSKKHLSNVKNYKRAKERQKYLDENFFTPPDSDRAEGQVDEKDENLRADPDQTLVASSVEQQTYDHAPPQVKIAEKVDQDILREAVENTKIDDNVVHTDNDGDGGGGKEGSDMEADQVITKEDLNKSKRKNKAKKKKSPQQKIPANPSDNDCGGGGVKLDTDEEVKCEFKCQICGEQFPSNSKLFKHIKQKGHAALKYDVPATKKKQKKKTNTK